MCENDPQIACSVIFKNFQIFIPSLMKRILEYEIKLHVFKICCIIPTDPHRFDAYASTPRGFALIKKLGEIFKIVKEIQK